MPIVRIRDPDACYKAAPVLFWAVMVTACRRYAKRESTFQFLVNAISSEVSSATASAPIRPPVITALLILSTWSLPTIRFMNDPTYVYTGIALNSSLFLGLHTGKGNYLELGSRYDTGTTDEEATYIWAASNIVSQRSVTGYYSTSNIISASD
jgi:transcriptional regulatory protein LEU3